jgi:arylsulfatase A-like enzyme
MGWIAATLLLLIAGTLEAAPKPDVVVIMTDDQDHASLAKMRHVNEILARKGATFSNYVVSIPLCCPSRTAHLTGQYGHNNGVMTNSPPSQGGFWEDKMLPVWLRQAGYRTGLVGKYVNFYGGPVGRPFLPQLHVPPGWDDWNSTPTPWMHRYYDFSINENGTLRAYPRSDATYQTDVMTRKALDFIEAQRNDARPFYLQVSYLAPHNAIHAPGKPTIAAPRHQGTFANEPLPQSYPSFNEADLSDKPSFLRRDPLTDAEITKMTKHHRDRLASLLAVDEGVRSIVDKLGEIGRLANTYIFFLSDNGRHAGQHRIPGGKQGYYEESIRVPLVVRGPGLPQDATRAELVANIDIGPTIADIADAAPNASVDGRSILPLLTSGGAWRTAVLIDGVILGREHPFDAVRTNRYLYVEHASGERELYDLRRDPYQVENEAAAPAYAGVLADVAGKLNALKACAGVSCWTTAPDVSPADVADQARTASGAQE